MISVIKNTKHEILNTKQYQSTNVSNLKHNEQGIGQRLLIPIPYIPNPKVWNIRISNFEFV